MFKVLFVVLLSVFSLTANASYCASRGDRCWNSVIDATSAGIERRLGIIMKSPANAEYKNEVNKATQDWIYRINTQCNSQRCKAENGREVLIWLNAEWIKVRKAFNLKDE